MVHDFPGDRPIDEALLREHKVSKEEYERILAALGRPPSYTELGVFSVMWSEHCSYKSSRKHLRRLPTTGPKVLQGPGENAGVVDMGDGFAAVFKIESHNHPSFIEPKQGAATGVGGILRDVFTMGARPIASLNSLRFGRPDHPRTKELLAGVVHGVGGYGNSIGVPTVGGEVQFDARYDGNILVNAFTCGVVRTDRIFYGRAAGVGNQIFYLGAKTGRDGIHGATMASDTFSEKEGDGLATAGSIRRGVRSTVQVGDPFRGKLLLEACLELFSRDILMGIQDMGAAGLTSSSIEMAGRAGTGVEIDLDLVPRRAARMSPYEILLSESQERMLLVAKPGCEPEVLAICNKWELDCAAIGRVTDSGKWVVKATPGYDPLSAPSGTLSEAAKRNPVVVCELPVAALTDDAPVYDRPQAKDLAPRGPVMPTHARSGLDLRERTLTLLRSPNIGSKSWIWQQYDHLVRGGTAIRPGADAGVVRVPCERDGVRFDKYLAFAVDGNGRFVEIDPGQGGAMVVAEVCRNLVCVGARPIGLTDCLNFGNPERPEVMRAFSDAIDGIAAACNALRVPIVGGNVSLYNDTDGRAIYPTPVLAGVGQLLDLDARVTPWWKGVDDVILLLGAIHQAEGCLAGSEVEQLFGPAAHGKPVIDLAHEARLQELVLALAEERVLRSAHDVSDGGLLVALLEGSIAGPTHEPSFGFSVVPPEGGSSDMALFGEGPTRVVVSVARNAAEGVLSRARDCNVGCVRLGVVVAADVATFTLPEGPFSLHLLEAKSAYLDAFRAVTA